MKLRENIGLGPFPLNPDQEFREAPYGGAMVLNPGVETCGKVLVNDKLTKEYLDSILD